jgi:hypothetical protein
VPLPYDPHDTTTVDPADTGAATDPSPDTSDTTTTPAADTVTATSAAATANGTHWSELALLAAVLATLLIVALGPQGLRSRQRRRRLHRARATGNPEPLWTEVVATAVDQRSLWPDTVTVAQVPAWLAGNGVDAQGQAAVTGIIQGLQLNRFSADLAVISADQVADVDQALQRWAHRTELRHRVLRMWLPASLISPPTRWKR